MKTLGFGLKSLMMDPAWASKHVGKYQQNNPIMPQENQNDVYAQNKSFSIDPGQSIFSQAKSGGIDTENNPFASGKSGMNVDSIFSQGKVGGIENQQGITEMMDKFDSKHNNILGPQGVQGAEQLGGMNGMPTDGDPQKKLGKKLNMLM